MDCTLGRSLFFEWKINSIVPHGVSLERPKCLIFPNLINSIDNLINELELGSVEPHSNKISNPEELGRWFSGAPSWVARS